MITSIAIQAYFVWMKQLFDRQGFDKSMHIVYSADDEGDKKLLDQDLANKSMERKSVTDRDTVCSGAYTYLFWTRGDLSNISRMSYRILEKPESGSGSVAAARQGKKTVSGSFTIACCLVSNKANLIEDFSEAYAAEYQNMPNMPVNLQYAYGSGDSSIPVNFTVIQALGQASLVQYKVGDLFSYSWSATVYVNYISEFARKAFNPLQSVVVDLYNPQGVTLASLDAQGLSMTTVHTATDGTKVTVPVTPYVSVEEPS